MKDQDTTFDPSKPCQTRDGQKVEILSVNGRGIYPIVGYVNDEGHPRTWLANGLYNENIKDHPFDLINIPAPKIPEPPEGREWANPDNLTEEQIGVQDGWRLLLLGETIPEEYEIWMINHWEEGGGYSGFIQNEHSDTRRTKAPLPEPPKPKKRVPLTFEDVAPFVGVEFRLSCVFSWISISSDGVEFYHIGTRAWKDLMDYEWRSVSNPNWQPCYKEVEG